MGQHGAEVGSIDAAAPAPRPGELWFPPSEGPLSESARYRNHPDVQRMMCDPSRNPDAAWFFITNFCRTIDDRHQIRPLAAHGYLYRYITTLERARLEGKNVLCDKPRQVRATWAGVAYFLWCMQQIEGFTGFMTTRKDDLVDDGGEHSSYKSMFGRMLHMWKRLPLHLKRVLRFTHMKAECEEMTSLTFGEAPTEDSGRSLNVSRALVDEFAKLRYDALTLASVAPMCPDGKILQSTQDGPDTEFARIQDEIAAGKLLNWLVVSIDWKDDYEKRGGHMGEGLRETTKEEAERLGPITSNWLNRATEGLTGDVIASEYLKSKDRSKKGRVYKNFFKEFHVAKHVFGLQPNLPIILGVDYGSTGFSAGAFGHPVGDRQVLVFQEYELDGAGGAPTHARNLWELLVASGYKGHIRDVELIGGPDTDIVAPGSGQTIAGYYREFGFTNIRQCRVRGPGSIDRRIAVVEVALERRQILISPSCKTLVQRFGEYRWPVNRVTGHIGGAKPAPGDANHIMDAMGYLCCEILPEETGTSDDDFINIHSHRTIPAGSEPPQRSVLDDDDDDDSPPSVASMRSSHFDYAGGF